ncbi:GNAT family N-acetyltransferase [Streptomyces sp. NPDC058877]|uniref:GNAT family N-acetyltransferase n=1 Tax=unclassified Streptomyces TaxID=2593676 RepID=UPI00369DA524
MRTPVLLHAAATSVAPALLLRPWREEDAPALVEVFRDPALRRSTSHVVDDMAGAERWVRDQQRSWDEGHRLGFAVLEEPAGPGIAAPVGSVVLKGAVPGAAAAEVGYWTAAPARGRGVAPRALEALTDWAFGAFGGDGLERLELLHRVDNPASCRVAHKSRYALDGILPAAPPAFPRDGHLHVRRLRPAE